MFSASLKVPKSAIDAAFELCCVDGDKLRLMYGEVDESPLDAVGAVANPGSSPCTPIGADNGHNKLSCSSRSVPDNGRVTWYPFHFLDSLFQQIPEANPPLPRGDRPLWCRSPNRFSDHGSHNTDVGVAAVVNKVSKAGAILRPATQRLEDAPHRISHIRRRSAIFSTWTHSMERLGNGFADLFHRG